MRRLAYSIALLVLMTAGAAAERRVALVIGNAQYRHATMLANPRNDALGVAAALNKLGFEVHQGLDLDKAAFERQIRAFIAALRGAEAGLFFYAGHGLQVAGQNYLVPIDARLADATALDFETVKLDVVHRAMESQTSTNILFLDACRDNPLARNLAQAMGTRSTAIGRGLAPVESGIGTLISFSTQPGNVALDGTAQNSPFAASLIRRLGSTDDDISALLISVRNDVMTATSRRQVPWEHSALTGRFYFRPPQKPVGTASIAPAQPVPSATSAPLTECDRRGAPEGSSNPAHAELAGVKVAELNTQKVIFACREAMQAHPNEPRFWSLLAKALYHHDWGGPNGWGSTDSPKYKEIDDLWRRAAAKNDAFAMVGLASHAQPAEKLEWLAKAAGLGEAAAFGSLGWYYDTTGPQGDTSKAAYNYLQGAKRGDSRSMGRIGGFFLEGIGVDKDLAAAVEWFEKGFAKGDPTSALQLGYMHELGLGDRPKDFTKARFYLDFAASKANESARRRLAKLLDAGLGGPKEPDRAATMLRLANKQAVMIGGNEVDGDMKDWSRETRIALQRQIRAAGHYKGPLNGVWDDAVRKAVEKDYRDRR